MTEIDIRIEAATSPVAGALIAALDADLVRRYPGQPTNGIDAASFEADGGVFAVGYVGGEPAFCGALRPIPNFGPYIGNPLSNCFEKRLGEA